MKLSKLLLLCLVLPACAQSSKIILPSGKVGHAINCSGQMMTMNHCYEKAGQQCPGGYVIMNRDREQHKSSSSQNSLYANQYSGQAQGFSYSNTYATRTIMVECKDNNKNIDAAKVRDLKKKNNSPGY